MSKWNQDTIGEWNNKVFGSDNTGIIGHFMEEVKEFDASIDTADEPAEAADLVILLMVRAHRAGYDLMEEVADKMEINVLRKWLPPDENGIVRHNKTHECGDVKL
jgi:hypothetical protein